MKQEAQLSQRERATRYVRPVWALGNPSPLIFSLFHLLLCLLVSFTFPFFPFLLASSFFLFSAFPSLPILPE